MKLKFQSSHYFLFKNLWSWEKLKEAGHVANFQSQPTQVKRLSQDSPSSVRMSQPGFQAHYDQTELWWTTPKTEKMAPLWRKSAYMLVSYSCLFYFNLKF